jgi:hypothetical protein
MSYGTLQVLDTIGVRKAAASDYLNTYDENELYQQVQMFLDAHNTLVNQITSDLVVRTTDRLTTWGGNATVDMIDGSEFSRPDVQKMQVPPTTLGFPLYLKQVAWGVTRLFMMNKTVKDLDEILVAIRDADIRDIGRSIRQALFNPTNSLTYTDKRVDGATIPLRRLLNADSAPIPPDPYGNTFTASTHTHFLGYNSGSFAVGDLSIGINHVLEHTLSGEMRVYIAKNLETTVRGFAGFYPYYDARLRLAADTTVAAQQTLDMENIQDRAIGIFESAEVFVRPWVPASYVFFFNATAPKPLNMRVRNDVEGSLHIAADIELYPLRAQFMEREYGVSVANRTNGACMLTTSGTYSAPAAWSF